MTCSRFIHLTDLHLLAPGAQALYGLDPLARLEAALADITLRHGAGSAAPAAFVLVTGDLVHGGDEAAYRSLAGALARTDLPVRMTLGNHDDRKRFRACFPGHPVDDAGFVQFALPFAGSTLLVLDTHVPDAPHGALCKRRLAWLGRQIEAVEGPLLLAMHHAPVATGLALMDRIGLRDPDAFWEVVGPARTRIRHLFFGHVHRPMSGSWRGIPISAGFGLAHQFALDFELVDGLRGCHEPPTYGVVQADDEQLVVHAHSFLDRSATFLL